MIPTGVSESRAAADTRHRVAYPNSRPRAIKLIGLGEGGGTIARDIAGRKLRQVEALVGGAPRGDTDPADLARALANEGSEIARAVREADMVFIVAREGDNVALAPAIGQMAHERSVLVTGMLIQDANRDVVARGTLDALRSASDMLVIVSDTEYVPEMLGALGA